MFKAAVKATNKGIRAARMLQRQTISGLKRAAAYYRRVIQTSMRYTKKGKRYRPSPPGQPPKAIRPKALLRRFIIFVIDERNYRVEIGPRKLGHGYVPAVLEEGGTLKRGKLKVGMLAPIRNGKDGKPAIIRLKTPSQVERASKLIPPSQRMQARPYLQPAATRGAHKALEYLKAAMARAFR